MDTVTVVYAVNSDFILYAAASINSIKKTANKSRVYKIYILYHSVSSRDLNLLEKLTNANLEVQCIDVSEYIAKTRMRTLDRFPEEIWFRFLIPDIFKQQNKAIYLDADTIVFEDIGKLYDIKMCGTEGYVCGAVEDANQGRKKLFGIERYYNSGVLLMNLSLMREEKIKDKCIELALRKSEMIMPDQDSLNVICKDRIYTLETKWNFMCHSGLVNENYKKSLRGKEIGIVHFAPTKPEYLPMCELTKLFWDSIDELNLFCQLMERKNNLSDKKRDADFYALSMVRKDFESGKLGFRNLLGLIKCWMKKGAGE